MMEETVQKLLSPGKGILAADESTKTITKRFVSLGLTSTPELNRKYREMLFTTPEIENYISGVILFDETVSQGFHEILITRGIIPGIKVDAGLAPFNGEVEQITQKPANLSGQLKIYREKGLKFTKWRGVFQISDLTPTDAFLEANLDLMAGFARISQDEGFVPIVEPEILLDGNYTTTRGEETQVKVLTRLFAKLKERRINLKNLILKTNMVLPGKASGVVAEPLEVANATLRSLQKSVPAEVPGIVFLSGGQTPDEATRNLNEIVKLKGNVPWEISFSFSRALQNEAMEVWAGQDANIVKAQETFIKRVKLVAEARQGILG